MGKKKDLLNPVIYFTNAVVSLFIFAAMLVLVLFIGYNVVDTVRGALVFDFKNTLHDIALLIVLVKAYRILLYYYREHHISIKYIVEISIIAPAIELLFAPTNHDLFTNILFASFSIANLVLYLLFFEKLWKADLEECKESHAIDRGSITG